jgi:hypothetical protein
MLGATAVSHGMYGLLPYVLTRFLRVRSDSLPVSRLVMLPKAPMGGFSGLLPKKITVTEAALGSEFQAGHR